MNTCKTCKYWHQEIPPYDKGPTTEKGSDKGYCRVLASLGYPETEEEFMVQGKDISVYDDSVPICTDEGFGCIHHELNNSSDKEP